MADLKNGQTIIFNQNLYKDADESSPELLLARKNEKGIILKKGSFVFEYYVQTNDKNPFYCNRKEFIINNI